MDSKKRTIEFKNNPGIKSWYSVVGEKEGEGPLKNYFDYVISDMKFGEETWEKAESKLMKHSIDNVIKKSGLNVNDIDFIFSGDLLNQCVGSNYALRDINIPHFGLYGACSTMAEGIILSAVTVDGGYSKNTLAVTSSHFCSAERQFRFPLEYGGTRPATSQWTVTGSGSVIISEESVGPYIRYATPGVIKDMGVKDLNNMGAAMAPAAADTLINFFKDTKTNFNDYDLVITGDLGKLGNEILNDLMKENGYDSCNKLKDCGMLIYDTENQDVHCGGSGCGCSASVLSGYILKNMKDKIFNNVIFIATGALMNVTLSQQGESIPGIAHLVMISNERNDNF